MATPEPTVAKAQLRPRAFILGVVLIPLVIFWVAGIENVYGGRPTYLSIFFHAVILLAALVGINTLLRVVAPRQRFSRAELLLIYVMIGASSGIVGDQFMSVLIPSLAYPFRYATPANHWAEKLLPNIPTWASVSDPVAVRHFYEGGSTLYTMVNLRPWLEPGLLWASFIAVTQLMCLGLNVLIRRQWTHYEKLSFPLVTIPMEMTAAGASSLWRQRAMWIGFSIAAFIGLVNGLHVYVPAIPEIPVKGRWISLSPQWDVGMTAIAFYPFIIGLAYLLPADLTFSTWFFMWFFRLQRWFFVAQLGFQAPYPWQTAHSAAPAMLEQGIGAYLAVVVFGLWAARRHLRAVWHAVLGKPEATRETTPIDARELGEYRLAMGFIAAGLILTTIFGVNLGMPAFTALAYLVLYLVINMAISKIRAEAGAPTHGFHFAGPDHILLTMIGPNHMRPREMAAWGLFFGFNRSYTGVPAPHQLEGMKIGELLGADRQRVTGALAIATTLGCFAGVWALLHLCFREGVEQMLEPVKYLSPGGWQMVNSWIVDPQGPNWPGLAGIVVGFGFSTLLMMMRFKYVWWQFHPIGYAIAADWTTGLIWLPLLIGWAWKILLMRYAGPKSYRKALPVALGLILGEFAVGGFWSVLAMITRKPQYHFWT